MRLLILFLSFIFQEDTLADEARPLMFMFWNLENFFDWKDSGISDSDREFSQTGERRWTKSRFLAKRNAVAKTILGIGEKYGALPDAIGFAEVENAEVIRSLVSSDILKKFGYSYVHYDSPDPRGIDVALIYRKESLSYISSAPKTMNFKTRDILYSSFRICGTRETIALLVNHHPSKYGGKSRSSQRRISALSALRDICDSLLFSGTENVVAMGDFNETPDTGVFDILEERMSGKFRDLESSPYGTIKYKGKWELIDLFFVSESLNEVSEMKICTLPFLLEQDKAFSGMKPARTYVGPRYNGGVSDHLPVLLFIRPVTEKYK